MSDRDHRHDRHGRTSGERHARNPRRRHWTRARRVRLLLLPVLLAAVLLGGGVGTATAAASSYGSFFEQILPQFMCTACHEPLELVSSPEAKSEKSTLMGFIKQGMTLPEVKRAMVNQYGEQVLARPPASGFNLTVYILPPVVVLAGLLLLAYTLPKWRRRARETAALPGSDPLNEEESSRLDSELDQFI